MSVNNIKPYIDTDIENIEFYLSWVEFKSPPSRKSLYSSFNKEEFYKTWDSILGDCDCETEVKMETCENVNEDGVSLSSKKYLSKLSENIMVSFFEEEDIVMNVTIYFKLSESEKVDKIISKINKTAIVYNSDNSDNEDDNIYKLIIDDSGSSFILNPLSINFPKWDDLDIYPKKVKKKTKNLSKSINNKTKGLHILSGHRGSGKTYLLKTLLSKVSKRVIYIPLSIFDLVLSNPKFIDFLKLYEDSLIVIDDCENYFNKAHQRSNLYVSNLLQILESIEEVNIHILLSINLPNTSIDENLLLSKSCLTNIDLKVIKGDEKEELSHKMGFNSDGTNPKSNKKYL